MLDSNLENLSNILNNMSLNARNTASGNNLPTITAAKEIANTIKPFTGRSEHLEYFINSNDKIYTR